MCEEPPEADPTGDDATIAAIVENDRRLYTAIGHFIVAFSQLEFSLRFALSQALSLNEEQFDAVTASYDFSALCRVTKAVYLTKHASDADRSRAIDELFKKCLGMHEQCRNPIVHATWAMTDKGHAARHVSRGSHKVTYPFESAELLLAKVEEVERLNVDVFRVLGGAKSA